MNIEQRYNKLMEAGKNGKFFTVKFIKRSTGEERTMNCRLNVQKHLKGGTKPYNDAEHRLLTVYDVKAEGYRCIPLDNLTQINGAAVLVN
jgi:hypothetical protein